MYLVTLVPEPLQVQVKGKPASGWGQDNSRRAAPTAELPLPPWIPYHLMQRWRQKPTDSSNRTIRSQRSRN